MAKQEIKKTEVKKANLALGVHNYKLLLIGFGIIVLGFILMSGGKAADPAVFNDEELYSFRRITLAPIVVILGFAFEIYAIMKRPK
ncbi:MAG: DUF3098 domain-containing protein [Prevotellaceae bacterium]|jgi:hypothetical protein|nr:DUF3098 domain-containing protein [Prevotellaceae bacterium]